MPCLFLMKGRFTIKNYKKILITFFILLITFTSLSFPSFQIKAESNYTKFLDVTITNYGNSNFNYTVNYNPLSLNIFKEDNALKYKAVGVDTIYLESFVDNKRVDSGTLTGADGRTVKFTIAPEHVGKTVRYVAYTTDSVDIDSPDDEQPTDNPSDSKKDYTSILNMILNVLDSNYSRLGSVNNSITIINNNITNATTIINNSLTTISNKLDTVNNSINSIKSELQTTKKIERNQPPNYKDILDNNKTSVPNNKFTDDNIYFDEPDIIENESTMPDLPDVKKWENVDEPTEMSKDEPIESDTELISDEFNQDNELIKDEFTQDNFSEDSELSKDNEFNKQEFELDNEFTQDDYNNTNVFEQTNKFEKTPDLERTETNANLRWKSVNGVFK